LESFSKAEILNSAQKRRAAGGGATSCSCRQTSLFNIQPDQILLLVNLPAAGGIGARAVPAAGRFIPS